MRKENTGEYKITGIMFYRKRKLVSFIKNNRCHYVCGNRQIFAGECNYMSV